MNEQLKVREKLTDILHLIDPGSIIKLRDRYGNYITEIRSNTNMTDQDLLNAEIIKIFPKWYGNEEAELVIQLFY